jgi:16S rRNA (adenine1518-N6/adenine1519-N6)-dimethyltransferase
MYTLKKSLGQHFLKDESVIARILEQLNRENCLQLLEVGPGGGALTKHLMQLTDIDFKAVELDEEKIQFLINRLKFPAERIISADFLNIDPPFSGSFHVIGNFPYNISSQILFKVLDWKAQVPVVIGMFQKEVAERVAAKPGKKDYGVISVLIQAYYSVEYLFDVHPDCFNPPPKVMSGVIRLERKSVLPEMASERLFRMLVKTAFNQRRKTLRNAVKSIFPMEVLQEPIFDLRAERLSLDDFAALTFRMNGVEGNTSGV